MHVKLLEKLLFQPGIFHASFLHSRDSFMQDAVHQGRDNWVMKTKHPNFFVPSTMWAVTTISLLASNFLPANNVIAQTNKPAVVIVHGAWGGAHHWRKVAELMAQQYEGPILRASLTGLGARSHLASPEVRFETHVQDVLNLIEFEGLEKVVLIGHSYGGTVISGVADKIPDRIVKRIYLDSHLMEDGESFLTHDPERVKRLVQRAEEDGEGYLIPVDWPNPMKDTPHPLRTLTEPIRLTDPAREDIPATYWLFTDGGDASKDSRYKNVLRAKERGYEQKNFPWGHNPHRDVPQPLSDALIAELR